MANTAASAPLKWTGGEPVEVPGVAFSMLMRLETGESISGARANMLDSIQKAFEEAGFKFVGAPENGAGVRWHIKI